MTTIETVTGKINLYASFGDMAIIEIHKNGSITLTTLTPQHLDELSAAIEAVKQEIKE